MQSMEEQLSSAAANAKARSRAVLLVGCCFPIEYSIIYLLTSHSTSDWGLLASAPCYGMCDVTVMSVLFPIKRCIVHAVCMAAAACM